MATFLRPSVASRIDSLVGSTSPRFACESPYSARSLASLPPLLDESAGWLKAESGTSSTAIPTNARSVLGRSPSHEAGGLRVSAADRPDGPRADS